MRKTLPIRFFLMVSVTFCLTRITAQSTGTKKGASIVTEYHKNGNKASEIDTISGYHKYYYENGKMEMQGKVTKDYRDSTWKYYTELGFLQKEEFYNAKGKLRSKEFNYFKNGKVMSEKEEYFEGDYKDKSTFKFYQIEKVFYTNGQLFSERHSINGIVTSTKCWDSKGHPQPIEYMDTVKSLEIQ
ncbi:hypothetical protein [Sediminibacterium ginsengisoli]|nr:hypothetical protein [Sediminibacterium ginsengisoli]